MPRRTPLVAAGVITDSLGRDWDPDLHPRGRDGKFIHTFRLLHLFEMGSSTIWGVGQVTEIKGDGTVRVKITDAPNLPDYVGNYVDMPTEDVQNVGEKASLTQGFGQGIKKYVAPMGDGDKYRESLKNFAERAGFRPSEVTAALNAFDAFNKNQLPLDDNPTGTYILALHASALTKDIDDEHTVSVANPHEHADYIDFLRDIGVPDDIVDDTPDGRSGLQFLADKMNAQRKPNPNLDVATAQKNDMLQNFKEVVPFGKGTLREMQAPDGTRIYRRPKSNGTEIGIIHPDGTEEEFTDESGDKSAELMRKALFTTAGTDNSKKINMPPAAPEAPAAPEKLVKPNKASLHENDEAMDAEFAQWKQGDDVFSAGAVSGVTDGAKLGKFHHHAGEKSFGQHRFWFDDDIHDKIGFHRTERAFNLDTGSEKARTRKKMLAAVFGPHFDKKQKTQHQGSPLAREGLATGFHEVIHAGQNAEDDELYAYHLKNARKKLLGTPATGQKIGPTYPFNQSIKDLKGETVASLDKVIADVGNDDGSSVNLADLPPMDFLDAPNTESKVDAPPEQESLYTDDHIGAADTYISEYYEINGSLRMAKGNIDEVEQEEIAEVILQLRDAIDTAPPLAPHTQLFRGLHPEDYDANDPKWQEFLDTLKPGKVIDDYGFVSTTTNEYLARDFATGSINTDGSAPANAVANPTGVVFQIDVPEGVEFKGLDMMEIGVGLKSEEEILLPDGTRFKIDSVDDFPGAMPGVMKFVKLHLATENEPEDVGPAYDPWLDDIMDSEGLDVKDALQHYVADSYDINDTIRDAGENAVFGGELKEQVDLIDYGMSEAPPLPEMTVYRGLGGDESYADKLQETIAKLKKGAVIKDLGYLSTSKDESTGEAFMGEHEGVLFRIHVPEGSRGIDMNLAFGEQSGEEEVLLPRGSQLRVDNVTQDDDHYIADVTLVFGDQESTNVELDAPETDWTPINVRADLKPFISEKGEDKKWIELKLAYDANDPAVPTGEWPVPWQGGTGSVHGPYHILPGFGGGQGIAVWDKGGNSHSIRYDQIDSVHLVDEPFGRHSIDTEQWSAVKSYAGSGAFGLNIALRSGEVPEQAETIDEVMEIAPPLQPGTPMLYRGLSGKTPEGHKLLESLEEGMVIHDKAFWSMTSSEKVGKHFSGGSGGAILEMEVPEGYRALKVADIGLSDYEGETIGPRNSSFVVESVEIDEEGIYRIRGRIVAPDNETTGEVDDTGESGAFHVPGAYDLDTGSDHDNDAGGLGSNTDVIDATGWTPDGPQSGFNTGGFFTDENGDRWYVKRSVSEDNAKNEILGTRIYERAGLETPHQVLAQTPFGGIGVASRIIEVEDNLDTMEFDPEYRNEIQKGFATDVWIANWDVKGAGPEGFKNIHQNVETGKPVRIEAGGALLYRGAGGLKGDKFTPDANEWDRFQDGKKSAGSLFYDMTDEERAASAQHLIDTFSPEDIDELVDSFEFTPDAAEELKTKLKSRRADIAEKALLVLPEDDDSPVEPDALTPEEFKEYDEKVSAELGPSPLGDPQVYLTDSNGEQIAVDEEMAPIIEALWERGFNTQFSDQGSTDDPNFEDSFRGAYVTFDDPDAAGQFIEQAGLTKYTGSLGFHDAVREDLGAVVEIPSTPNNEVRSIARWHPKHNAEIADALQADPELLDAQNNHGQGPGFPSDEPFEVTDPEDIELLIADLPSVQEGETDDDIIRRTYTRWALESNQHFGDNAVTFAETDGEGFVRGAATMVRHDDEAGSYYMLDYIGSRQPGTGSKLLAKLQERAAADNRALVLEPTEDSIGWWSARPGIVDDPTDAGTEMMGWSAEALKSGNLGVGDDDQDLADVVVEPDLSDLDAILAEDIDLLNNIEPNGDYFIQIEPTDLHDSDDWGQLEDVAEQMGLQIDDEDNSEGEIWAVLSGKGLNVVNFKASYLKTSDKDFLERVEKASGALTPPDDTDPWTPGESKKPNSIDLLKNTPVNPTLPEGDDTHIGGGTFDTPEEMIETFHADITNPDYALMDQVWESQGYRIEWIEADNGIDGFYQLKAPDGGIISFKQDYDEPDLIQNAFEFALKTEKGDPEGLSPTPEPDTGFDAQGQYFKVADGAKVHVGDKVKSLTDGSIGEVVGFESNGEGIKIKTPDGKKKARKRWKLVAADPSAANYMGNDKIVVNDTGSTFIPGDDPSNKVYTAKDYSGSNYADKHEMVEAIAQFYKNIENAEEDPTINEIKTPSTMYLGMQGNQYSISMTENPVTDRRTWTVWFNDTGGSYEIEEDYTVDIASNLLDAIDMHENQAVPTPDPQLADLDLSLDKNSISNFLDEHYENNPYAGAIFHTSKGFELEISDDDNPEILLSDPDNKLIADVNLADYDELEELKDALFDAMEGNSTPGITKVTNKDGDVSPSILSTVASDKAQVADWVETMWSQAALPSAPHLKWKTDNQGYELRRDTYPNTGAVIWSLWSPDGELLFEDGQSSWDVGKGPSEFRDMLMSRVDEHASGEWKGIGDNDDTPLTSPAQLPEAQKIIDKKIDEFYENGPDTDYGLYQAYNLRNGFKLVHEDDDSWSLEAPGEGGVIFNAHLNSSKYQGQAHDFKADIIEAMNNYQYDPAEAQVNELDAKYPELDSNTDGPLGQFLLMHPAGDEYEIVGEKKHNVYVIAGQYKKGLITKQEATSELKEQTQELDEAINTAINQGVDEDEMVQFRNALAAYINDMNNPGHTWDGTYVGFHPDVQTPVAHDEEPLADWEAELLGLMPSPWPNEGPLKFDPTQHNINHVLDKLVERFKAINTPTGVLVKFGNGSELRVDAPEDQTNSKLLVLTDGEGEDVGMWMEEMAPIASIKSHVAHYVPVEHLQANEPPEKIEPSSHGLFDGQTPELASNDPIDPVFAALATDDNIPEGATINLWDGRSIQYSKSTDSWEVKDENGTTVATFSKKWAAGLIENWVYMHPNENLVAEMLPADTKVALGWWADAIDSGDLTPGALMNVGNGWRLSFRSSDKATILWNVSTGSVTQVFNYSPTLGDDLKTFAGPIIGLQDEPDVTVFDADKFTLDKYLDEFIAEVAWGLQGNTLQLPDDYELKVNNNGDIELHYLTTGETLASWDPSLANLKTTIKSWMEGLPIWPKLQPDATQSSIEKFVLDYNTGNLAPLSKLSIPGDLQLIVAFNNYMYLRQTKGNHQQLGAWTKHQGEGMPDIDIDEVLGKIHEYTGIPGGNAPHSFKFDTNSSDIADMVDAFVDDRNAGTLDTGDHILMPDGYKLKIVDDNGVALLSPAGTVLSFWDSSHPENHNLSSNKVLKNIVSHVPYFKAMGQIGSDPDEPNLSDQMINVEGKPADQVEKLVKEWVDEFNQGNLVAGQMVAMDDSLVLAYFDGSNSLRLYGNGGSLVASWHGTTPVDAVWHAITMEKPSLVTTNTNVDKKGQLSKIRAQIPKKMGSEIAAAGGKFTEAGKKVVSYRNAGFSLDDAMNEDEGSAKWHSKLQEAEKRLTYAGYHDVAAQVKAIRTGQQPTGPAHSPISVPKTTQPGVIKLPQIEKLDLSNLPSWTAMHDEKGEYRVDKNGYKVHIGDKVHSTTDGLKGTVVGFEPGLEGFKVKDDVSGKTKARKWHKLALDNQHLINAQIVNAQTPQQQQQNLPSTPKSKPDPSSPWYGKDKPSPPSAPDTTGVVSKWVDDEWMKKADENYRQQMKSKNPSWVEKPLAQSTKFQQYVTVQTAGSIQQLQALLNAGRITQEMFDDAKKQIDENNKLLQVLQDKHAVDVKKWQADVQAWYKANGSPLYQLKGMDVGVHSMNNDQATKFMNKHQRAGALNNDPNNPNGLHKLSPNAYSAVSSQKGGTISMPLRNAAIDTTKPNWLANQPYHVKSEIEHMDLAMQESPPVAEDFITIRTVSTGAFKDPVTRAKLPHHHDISYLVGTIQNDWGFAESSPGDPKAGATEGYPGKEVVMRIRVPAGTRGVWTLTPGQSFGYHNERGFVLDRGLFYYIHSVEYKQGKWRVDAEIIPKELYEHYNYFQNGENPFTFGGGNANPVFD